MATVHGRPAGSRAGRRRPRRPRPRARRGPRRVPRLRHPPHQHGRDRPAGRDQPRDALPPLRREVRRRDGGRAARGQPRHRGHRRPDRHHRSPGRAAHPALPRGVPSAARQPAAPAGARDRARDGAAPAHPGGRSAAGHRARLPRRLPGPAAARGPPAAVRRRAGRRLAGPARPVRDPHPRRRPLTEAGPCATSSATTSPRSSASPLEGTR